jgi:hypothetical protein
MSDVRSYHWGIEHHFQMVDYCVNGYLANRDQSDAEEGRDMALEFYRQAQELLDTNEFTFTDHEMLKSVNEWVQRLPRHLRPKHELQTKKITSEMVQHGPN